MMAEKELTINALPAKTWRWMKMNDSPRALAGGGRVLHGGLRG